MPIYRFRCSECLEEEEILLPMANRNDMRLHSCGAVMEKLMSVPSPATFKVYNKEKVLNTLNEEAKHPVINGGAVRSKRSQRALARGLDYSKPVIGRGF